MLTNRGIPEINASFKLSLSDAKENANGLLLVGASDKIWNAIGLPFDLKVLGAPGCVLLASGEAMFPVTTSDVGTAGQTFAIPNITSLVGLVFFNQYLISDSANAFGIVFSNGGQGKIGRQ